MLDVVFFGLEKVGGIIMDGDGFDFVTLFDRVDDVLTHGHLAEYGVATVQMRGGVVGDEKLTAIGVWAGVGHGENASLIVFKGAVDFIKETIAGTA